MGYSVAQQSLFCLCFFMQSMLAIKGAIFIQFQLTLNILSILVSCVILTLALTALQCDDFNSGLLLASHFASPMIKYRQNRRCNRAFERDRTADLNLTMVALCRLSYRGKGLKRYVSTLYTHN